MGIKKGGFLIPAFCKYIQDGDRQSSSSGFGIVGIVDIVAIIATVCM